MRAQVVAWCFLIAVALSGAAAAPAQAADACPNAAYRTGAGANLPDCRAYEQATPANKNGIPASADFPTVAARSGSRALFSTFAAIGIDDSSFLLNTYAASRGAAWTSVGLSPPQGTTSLFSQGPLLGFNDEVTKAFVASRRKLTPDAVEGDSNFYVRDLTNPTSYRLVVTDPGGDLYRDSVNINNGVPYAATADYTHIAFRVSRKLTSNPADPDDGTVRLYRWDDGVLRFVDANQASNGTMLAETNLLSQDGKRLTYTPVIAGASPSLVQQAGTDAPKLIARSHRTTPNDDPTEPQGVSAAWASPDGTRVDFDASVPLLNGQVPGLQGIYATLYRWNAATDGIVDLLAGKLAGQGQTGPGKVIQRESQDGNYVYFTSSARLAPGAVGNENNLYVLHVPDGRLSHIATFTSTGDQPGKIRLSPDGTRIAFVSYSPLRGYDNNNAACVDRGNAPLDGICSEVWTFDATTPSQPVRCASCPPAGTSPTSNATLGYGEAQINAAQTHPVTDDGRVYFDTAERLAPGDSNTVSDVYEFSPTAGQRLISGGAGGNAATLGDVSASGDDVYFLTADALVPQDDDGIRDLYDARVGGGLASQQTAPSTGATCQGSDCQGAPPAAALPTKPGTSSFTPFEPPRAATFKASRLSRASLRALAAGRRASLSVKVGAAGKVTLRARARIGRRTVTVGTASVTAKKAGTVRLAFTLSRSARRELKKRGKLAVAATVAYSKADDDATIRFTIKQPKAGSTSKGGRR